MDIVILGYMPHPYTRAILRECKQRRIPVKALVQRWRIEYPPELVLQNMMSVGLASQGILRQLITVENIKRAFYNPDFALKFLVQLLKRSFKSDKAQVHPVRVNETDEVNFRELTVKTVNDFNSKSCQQLLRNLAPDLIILGPATQIIKGNIFKIPRIGILNAHQGLLPKYRGMDVLEYAILNGDNPGITVHFVDEGVDTGDIILRRRIQVSPVITLSVLRQQAIKLSVKALLDAVEIIESGNYQRERQNQQDGKQYFPIHYTLRDMVCLKLQKEACIANGMGPRD